MPPALEEGSTRSRDGTSALSRSGHPSFRRLCRGAGWPVRRLWVQPEHHAKRGQVRGPSHRAGAPRPSSRARGRWRLWFRLGHGSAKHGLWCPRGQMECSGLGLFSKKTARTSVCVILSSCLAALSSPQTRGKCQKMSQGGKGVERRERDRVWRASGPGPGPGPAPPRAGGGGDSLSLWDCGLPDLPPPPCGPSLSPHLAHCGG